MSKALSQPEYLEKFGLKEQPYSTNPDERFLILSEHYKEAIALCADTIDNREGACLIMGEQGTGKTTIMRRIATLLISDPDYKVAVIPTAAHCPSPFQMVKEIIEEFGGVGTGINTKARTDVLKTLLSQFYDEGKNAVVLIDEAQQMSKDMLEAIRGYLNFESPQTGKLLQVVLFGMPGINRKLGHSSLKSRLAGKIYALDAMSWQEASEMLKCRFTTAGGTNFPFQDNAIAQIHAIADGNPRYICALAKISLRVAAQQDKIVTPELVSELATQFKLSLP